MRKCSFSEYQCWVMTNFLFSTGVRQRSLINILIRDIDFDNRVVYIRVTKARKPLVIPLGATMLNILREFLRRRQHKSKDDFMFCNVFGQQLVRSTCISPEMTSITGCLHGFRRIFLLISSWLTAFSSQSARKLQENNVDSCCNS